MKNQSLSISAADRREVLKSTWALVKKSGLRFADALKKAWAAIKLKLALARTDEKGVWVEFTKKDGTRRNILATRNLAHIPAMDYPKGTGSASPLTIGFYDLFAGSWKSALVENLIIA